VYPRQTMLDDVEIDTSSYDVVNVDMVYENSKDLKLKVPPDDTTLTLRDVVTRRVQCRWTSIDVDPSAVASVSITPSQPNTSPASIFIDAYMTPSPNLEHLRMSPI
jgi:vancomycin resistance protein YoaR